MTSREEEMLRYLVRLTVSLSNFVVVPEIFQNLLRSNGLYVLTMLATSDHDPDKSGMLKHILEVDVFNLLVILVTSFPIFKKKGGSKFGSDDHNILRLCTLTALIQIVAGLNETVSGDLPETSSEEEENDEKEVLRLVKWVSTYVGNADKLPKELILRTVKAKMLRFLRCASLFFHFYTDVPLPKSTSGSGRSSSLSEAYKSLSDYLSLPTLGCLISHPFTFEFVDR